jgi:hypothetical protein
MFLVLKSVGAPKQTKGEGEERIVITGYHKFATVSRTMGLGDRNRGGWKIIQRGAYLERI